jgi:putative SOS response-associated peptidase YedK
MLLFNKNFHTLILTQKHKLFYTTGNSLFVILTHPALTAISFIHDRMPIIIPKERHDEWLFGQNPANVSSYATTKIDYEAV